MEWLKKLSDAIDYIEKNLDGEISYEEAARIACCSVYYFQRMFTYVAGITLAEYIRRRRMTQAAFELQRTETKVVDIALKYGYTSPTSFNRAFQKVHGISPKQAKIKGCSLNVYPVLRFSVTVMGGESMTYRMEQKEEIRIVGIRTPMTEDMEENQKNIPGFWEKSLKSENIRKICQLSDREPKGGCWASVYTRIHRIYTITLPYLQTVQCRMECMSIPYLPPPGLFSKMTGDLRKVCRAFSAGFMRIGSWYPVMNMQVFRI